MDIIVPSIPDSLTTSDLDNILPIRIGITKSQLDSLKKSVCGKIQWYNGPLASKSHTETIAKYGGTELYLRED